jgi:hypothetical protein
MRHYRRAVATEGYFREVILKVRCLPSIAMIPYRYKIQRLIGNDPKYSIFLHHVNAFCIILFKVTLPCIFTLFLKTIP